MRILCFLLVTLALNASTVFSPSGTNTLVRPTQSFAIFGTPSLTTTPLPQSGGITGFKLSGEAAARNTTNTACPNCELEVQALGTISSNTFATPTVGVSWDFTVDEFALLPKVGDGNSNVLSGITNLPPTRDRNLNIEDGTSNTIIFPVNFTYRLLLLYEGDQSAIQDGSSNTIVLIDLSPQTLASGSGLYGDRISGSSQFRPKTLLGGFTLALIISPIDLDVNHGIRLTIPTNSIDINPVSSVPEPSTFLLAASTLALLRFKRKNRIS